MTLMAFLNIYLFRKVAQRKFREFEMASELLKRADERREGTEYDKYGQEKCKVSEVGMTDSKSSEDDFFVT